MSEQRQFVRRTVRRLRYDDNGSTIDVTTVITPPRPTRTPPPPPIPGTVETPPAPPPVLARFPVSERFMQTISRAAELVDGDHPLHNAAEALNAIAALPPPRAGRNRVVIGTISRPVRARPRKKIIYDTVLVDETKKIEDTDKCPICLQEYEEGDKCGVLPCKHNFHDNCIRQWVDEKRNCPLCRLHLN